MDGAAAWLDESASDGGVILTTDADSRVAANWVDANLSAIALGADVVLGCISLDEEGERLPPALHARGRLEAVYEDLLTEMSARLDPQVGNPWPHHSTISGASLALTAEAYRRVGGLPRVALGEDKALIAALRRMDACIRFAPDVRVITSGRTSGRAPGGVADTLRLRSADPAAPCDELLEPCGSPTGARFGAAGFAAAACRAHGGERRCVCRRAPRRAALAAPTFGAAWEAIEQASPVLVRRGLPPAELPVQIEAARRLLQRLEERLAAARTVETVLWTPLAADDVDAVS